MKKLRMSLIVLISAVFMITGCASWTKTQKGAVVGSTTGGAAGAIIGRASGNTALGAIIGTAVGGATGVIIGNQMDKQAEEIAKTVPDVKVERIGEGIVVEFNSDVLFGYDQSDLSYQAENNLNKLVEVLNNYKETDIELQGHTDSKGSVAYNNALSERRALAVSDYLVSQDISSSRLKIIGYGELSPKYLNDTEAGRAQNRRVEFLITANEKMKAEAAASASN